MSYTKGEIAARLAAGDPRSLIMIETGAPYETVDAIAKHLADAKVRVPPPRPYTPPEPTPGLEALREAARLEAALVYGRTCRQTAPQPAVPVAPAANVVPIRRRKEERSA